MNNRCASGKKKYHSEARAKHAIVMMRRAECPGVEYTHVYACRQCGRWHVGKENVPEIEKEVIPLKIAAKKRIFASINDVENFEDFS
jgi:hypothetical protein